MPNSNAWQHTVREAARQAAKTEDDARALAKIGHAPTFTYRWEHVQAVVRLAVRLAELTGADRDVVEAAAWLHDVAKADSKDDHGRAGAIKARFILMATDFPPAKIEAVTDAISKHVGLTISEQAAQPLEAAVLWDADKLSKLGLTSMMCYIGYEWMSGAISLQEQIDRLAASEWYDIQDATQNCFLTEPARQAAVRRIRTYREFCAQAQHELDAEDVK